MRLSIFFCVRYPLFTEMSQCHAVSKELTTTRNLMMSERIFQSASDCWRFEKRTEDGRKGALSSSSLSSRTTDVR